MSGKPSRAETPECNDFAIKAQAWPSAERSWPPASGCNVIPSQPGDNCLSWTLPAYVVQVGKLLAPYKSSLTVIISKGNCKAPLGQIKGNALDSI